MMAAAIVAMASTASSANAYGLGDPLRFFVGTTESVTTVSVLMRKAYSARARGYGEIGRDGSLSLVQRVEDEGKKPFERRDTWYIIKLVIRMIQTLLCIPQFFNIHHEISSLRGAGCSWSAAGSRSLR